MQLTELLDLVVKHPVTLALHKIVSERKQCLTHVKGLQASAAPVVFASLTKEKNTAKRPYLFILNDEEEAGYFYHDLTQLLGDEQVLFYPSAYRRAVKYAQRDAANEILRTETLNRLTQQGREAQMLLVVTFPEAVSERVSPPQTMEQHTMEVKVGGQYDLVELTKRLTDLGFNRTDYVYQPGEFAVRGSILDVYSYASEYPFRIDFFGDDVERTR